MAFFHVNRFRYRIFQVLACIPWITLLYLHLDHGLPGDGLFTIQVCDSSAMLIFSLLIFSLSYGALHICSEVTQIEWTSAPRGDIVYSVVHHGQKERFLRTWRSMTSLIKKWSFFCFVFFLHQMHHSDVNFRERILAVLEFHKSLNLSHRGHGFCPHTCLVEQINLLTILYWVAHGWLF